MRKVSINLYNRVPNRKQQQQHLDCLLNVKYATCTLTFKFSIVKQH